MTAQELAKIAKEVRKDIIRMLATSGSGHTAGPLGSADLFTAFYFGILNQDPKNPSWEERDRFILSCGHYCPAQYATLAEAGYFPKTLLSKLRKLGSPLQGHPVRGTLPGIETTSGPLGCGLAQAAGIALAGRLDEKHFRVYCLTSDGEHDSGNHWEAVAFAAKYKLGNLTAIVDKNGIQIDGNTKDVMPMEPLKEKYLAFNWNVIEVDGHDFHQIFDAVNEARKIYDKPTVIIAKTIPGKGVSFMEDDFTWHGMAPSKEEAARALEELK
jgi:transketolase